MECEKCKNRRLAQLEKERRREMYWNLIGLYVGTELKQRLRTAAEKRNITMSQFMRELLERELRG